MDAKTMVSLLIVKLQNLFPEDKERPINPRTQTQVKKAIHDLQLWKQCLKDDDDVDDDSTKDRRIAQLLQAYYSAEEAIEILPIKDQLYGYSHVRQPFTGFKVLRLQCFFTNGMEKFKNEVRGLPCYDHQLEMKEVAKKCVEYTNDASPSSTTSVSSGNDATGPSQQQHQLELKEAVTIDIKDDAGQSSTTSLSLGNDAGEPSQQQEQLKLKKAVTIDFEIDNGTGQKSNPSLSSGNDAGGPRQQQHWGRISEFYLEETNIVGLSELLKQLITKDDGNKDTTNEHSDQYSTQMIALIGERGSGKTFLTRNAWVEVKSYFPKRAWVHIPGYFKARDALVDILKQIHPPDMLQMEATISQGELVQRIIDVLYDSTYLLVMENFEKSQVWESFLSTLCSSTKRGKIILTSVQDYVADTILHVPRLTAKDSWELFLKKERRADSSELIGLKDQILNLCDGLPLRIVLLAGLFFTKEVSQDKWSKLIELANKIDVLALSYEELPSQLKLCFLYMGIFPREYEIPVRRLIHLWCAEGFVTPLDSKAKTSEDLAEMYFEELVIRNMIQVIRWKLHGIPKTCRMSGVLYDFLSAKAAEAGFFYHQLNSSNPSAAKFPVRRLAAKVGIKNNIPSSSLHLRSYIAFDSRIRGTPAAREINRFLTKIINSERTGFGILKVLDLEGVYKPEFRKAVAEQLPLLRYLGLRSTFIDSLPDVQLSYLETLDVSRTRIKKLHSSIMPKRHIYMNWFKVEWCLQNSGVELQTLWGAYMKDDSATEFLKLIQSLRRLGLKCELTSTVEKIADCLPQLPQLHSLKLILEPNDIEIPDNLLPKMEECSKLQEVYLHGKLPSDPHSNDLSFPPNLTTLTLSNSNLEIDPMPVLGKLQHLKILRLLGDSYNGDKITCLSEGFPKLLVLKLWKLQLLSDWTVEEGAMLSLREVEIRQCQSLFQLPEDLKHLKTLTELVITNMPSEFKVADGILGKNVCVRKMEFL